MQYIGNIVLTNHSIDREVKGKYTERNKVCFFLLYILYIVHFICCLFFIIENDSMVKTLFLFLKFVLFHHFILLIFCTCLLQNCSKPRIANNCHIYAVKGKWSHLNSWEILHCACIYYIFIYITVLFNKATWKKL